MNEELAELRKLIEGIARRQQVQTIAIQLMFANVPGMLGCGMDKLTQLEDGLIAFPLTDDQIAKLKVDFLHLLMPFQTPPPL